MKPPLRLASLVLARLGQGLSFLNEVLKGGMPHREPQLVPIPIRPGRKPPSINRRHPGQGG
jgi:hypothetical protein